jgi:hypothetical protein
MLKKAHKRFDKYREIQIGENDDDDAIASTLAKPKMKKHDG